MQVPVNLVSSPLNYTGGKFKLLPQILPLFPNDINCFYDIFCGGCNVSINVTANKIICNDFDREQDKGYNTVEDYIEKIKDFLYEKCDTYEFEQFVRNDYNSEVRDLEDRVEELEEELEHTKELLFEKGEEPSPRKKGSPLKALRVFEWNHLFRHCWNQLLQFLSR